MNISEFLEQTTQNFREKNIPSPRLDAELILMRSGNFSREFLLAHDDFLLPKNVLRQAKKFVKMRSRREPIAYIFNEKEFYGRNFFINKNVLIPRPETEAIIELSRKIITQKIKKNELDLLEIGVGSGAIFITLFLEFPQKFSRILAIDLRWKILTIAKNNLARLMPEHREKQAFEKDHKTKFGFIKSDLLAKIREEKFDLIVANLPYVSHDWDAEIFAKSPELAAEPALALFAEDGGNALNKKLIQQITEKNSLNKDGFLILELDPEQKQLVAEFAKNYGFKEEIINPKQDSPYHLVLKKFA